MACLWRKHAHREGKKPPADVPPGHLAVTVGESNRRFVIRADYLNHPIFQQLLEQAYEGYDPSKTKSGPLPIPCDECLFEDIVQFLRLGADPRRLSCHRILQKLEFSLSKESLPLIRRFDSESSNMQHLKQQA